ncbi:MAG: hypothetical protein ACFFER_01205 [Candidatus Thorarchaeota archaeon]
MDKWIGDLLDQLGEVPELIAGIIMIVVVWLMGIALESTYPGARAGATGIILIIVFLLILSMYYKSNR